VVRHTDERAFRTLYDRHTPRLLRFALRLTAGEGAAVAEDVVQETWVRAVERLDDFGWRSSLVTWLHGIALNVAREAWRASLRTVDVDCDDDGSPVRELAVTQVETEARIDLERGLARLPEGRRTVLVLHDLYGYKHAEVARMLDISEGTSKSQLHDARLQLGSILGREGRK
jgi:RNA polymerase sigma-70 factor (ECF subfamily)